MALMMATPAWRSRPSLDIKDDDGIIFAGDCGFGVIAVEPRSTVSSGRAASIHDRIWLLVGMSSQ